MKKIQENALKICVAYLLVVSIQCLDPLYTVTAPKVLRPNSPYHVVVTVHHAPAPVDVEVTLKSNQVNSTEKLDVKDVVKIGETKLLELNVGEWKSRSYTLTVAGSGGIIFNKSERVDFSSKTISVHIQTDKAIYQPGQIVHFRVISINSTLHPNNPDAVVYIQDGRGNRIKQWKNISFSNGLYAGDLQLSDQVVLGDWQIFVSIKEDIYSKSFTVAEYVLPTFEVEIQLPPFATYNDSDVVATVVAKYTYGKPVKGQVLLNVTDYYCQYPCVSSNVKPFALQSSIDGKAEMRFNLVRDLKLPDWYRYGMNRFKFLAQVTESLTGRQQNGTADFNLYQSKYKLSFDIAGSFKPNLKYSTDLKILLQDDTPVSDNINKVSVKYSYTWNEDQQVVNYSIPQNGIIHIDIVPPESASLIRFEATYKDVTTYASVDRAQSLSERYIQVTLLTQNPKIGDEVEMLINSTKSLEDSLIVEVIGRGKVLYVTSIPGNKENSQLIKFPVTPIMAPKVRVIVYYATMCGEVVADALDFGVDGIFRTPVSVNVSSSETEPGNAIEVSVKTNPNIFVGLSAIDQSVLLLKSGNDITEKEVLTDMQYYEIGQRPPLYFDNYRVARSFIRPWRPRSSSTIELFTNVGFILFTNGLLARYPSYGGYGGGGFGGGVSGEESLQDFGAARPFMAARPQMGLMDSAPAPAAHSREPNLMEPSRLRQFFPETFLWTNATSGADGIVSIKAEAPDTITSYFINAFAMDGQNGLGLSNAPTKMRIFRPFFVTLNLPYSVVRGETLALQALVFNYLKDDVQAEVTLSNDNDELSFVDLENDIDQDTTQKQLSKTVTVKSGEGTSVFFYITPKKLGYLDIKVTARSTVAADALLRKLLVKAEGVPVYINKALIVDLRDQPTFEEKIKIEFPKTIVPDSERIEISAISDIMGTTINNLDKLLRMPYGCGEQNMLNFVPNIVVADYLSGLNQFTGEIKDKAIKFMESGYQRELTYKRSDGSFSAFGNSDKAGSTWLTAFVVKSFIQAKKFITIDDDVIKTSLAWLSMQRSENGSFSEVGTVFHKAMQGGSSQGMGLTAYILSAYLESKASNFEANNEHLDSIISKSLELLEQDLDQIESDYDLVFVTYVLHLANSSAKDTAFKKMDDRAKTEGDLKYWSVPLPEVNQSDPFSYYNRPRSVDVEMTSYALLTYTLRGLIADGIPIMKWLVSKRNENGGYESTQDTVVGIQSLAKYAAKLSGPADSGVNIKFAYEGGQKEMILNKENALVLHKEQLPSTTREVTLTANGKGTSVVQVTWSYNKPTVEDRPTFEIITNAVSDRDLLEVEACTKYIYETDGESNMAVMEIAFPSGYTADKGFLPRIDEEKQIKRVETKDGDSVVVLYFDKIGKKVCTTTKAQRNNKVADMKPALVKVYDYYEPEKNAEKMYDAPKTELCDLCETDKCKDNCKQP